MCRLPSTPRQRVISKRVCVQKKPGRRQIRSAIVFFCCWELQLIFILFDRSLLLKEKLVCAVFKKSGFLVYRSGHQMLDRDGFPKVMQDHFATNHQANWAVVTFFLSFIVTFTVVLREETSVLFLFTKLSQPSFYKPQMSSFHLSGQD